MHAFSSPAYRKKEYWHYLAMTYRVFKRFNNVAHAPGFYSGTYVRAPCQASLTQALPVSCLGHFRHSLSLYLLVQPLARMPKLYLDKRTVRIAWAP
jgi:hypothetical protein